MPPATSPSSVSPALGAHAHKRRRTRGVDRIDRLDCDLLARVRTHARARRIEQHQHLGVRRPHDQLGDTVAHRPKRTDRLAAGKPGSQRSRCSGEPACSIRTPANTQGSKGTGASVRPSSSQRIESSTSPSPCPPYSSAIAIPGQPSSHSSRHNASSRRAGLGMLTHSLRPGPLCQQLTGSALDLALVCAQAEVHRSRLRAVSRMWSGHSETTGTPNSGAPPGAEPIPITTT